jgi:hypothetical protein
VLQVISSSVSDARPVFDKILESGAALFATDQLGIFLAQEDGLCTRARGADRRSTHRAPFPSRSARR